MINLLSENIQKQHRAAHLNLRLRGYALLLLVALIASAGIFGAGFYLTLEERAIAETESTKNSDQLAVYAPIRQRADAFTQNLKIAKTILSQEVLYSDMVVRIANTLPPSAVLTSLSIDQKTLEKPVMLSARVKTKNDAIVLKSTLENSPIFEDVNINNIAEEQLLPGETNATKISHPVLVTLTVTFTKGSQESLLP